MNCFLQNRNNVLLGKPNKPGDFDKKKKMLLIDEVDVFFTQDFYGNTYNPILLVNNESVTELIEYIFEQNVDFLKVKESPIYKKIVQQFSNFKWLIDTEIQKMLKEKQDYKNPLYVVQDAKIGYQ